jgi:glycerol-3-phosphate acyltransferase PlsY
MTPTSPALWLCAVCVLVTYLVCGIPFGLIIASRRAGVDVRSAGSGNIGTTNVSRTVGASAGGLTLLCDAGKGLVCTLVSSQLLGSVVCCGGVAAVVPGGIWAWMMGLVYLAAICGHVFSPYLHFHGGKGIAVGFGAALGFMWPVALGLLAFFVLFALPSRYVSLGSVAAAVSLPFLCWFFYQPSLGFMVPIVCVSAVVVWAHRANIAKLAHGTEKRFSFHHDDGPKKGDQA